MKSTSAIFFLALILNTHPDVHAAQPAAVAREGDEKSGEVVVSGTRNPELKPYRVMSAGLDAFDEHRRLAPDAALRFRLSKRADLNGQKSDWHGVSLRLAGSETSTPVPISSDGTFLLPRSKDAYDDEADFILNQKKSSIRFAPEVRTPGIAGNARRLGDLRLECQVLVAIGKKEVNFAIRAAINAYAMGGDWCSVVRKNFSIDFTLPDWPLSTTLAYGGKREPLRVTGYHFRAPIQNKALPDDALIEFEFWSDASAERKRQLIASLPIHLKSSADNWGAGQPMTLKENGQYDTLIALKSGAWKFALKSPAGELYLGAGPGQGDVAIGVGQSLRWHEYRNFTFNVEQAGTYSVSLNVQDPDRPLAIVKRIE